MRCSTEAAVLRSLYVHPLQGMQIRAEPLSYIWHTKLRLPERLEALEADNPPKKGTRSRLLLNVGRRNVRWLGAVTSLAGRSRSLETSQTQ